MSFLGKRPPRLNETLHDAYHYTWDGTRYVQSGVIQRDPFDKLVANQFSSVTTPGFKRLKKRSLPENSFHAWRTVQRDSTGWIQAVQPNGWIETGLGKQVMSTSLSALMKDPYGPDEPDVAAESVRRALKSLSNLKFNAAQAFAERKQTADLLIKSVNRFVTFAVLMRKGNFSAANRVLSGRRELFTGKRIPRDTLKPPSLDTFANIWLEYSYGWRPLVGDIYGSAELLAQVHDPATPRPTRVTGTFSKSASWVNVHTDSGLTGRASMNHTVKAKTILYCEVESTALDLLKSTGLSNPALLAWELLPYSFVVDWVYPVGSYLENMNASSGLRFIRGSTSVLGRGSGRSSSSSDGSFYRTSAFPAELEWAELTRTTLGGFPSASLPSFKFDLNVSQVTSGLALLSQIFRK